MLLLHGLNRSLRQTMATSGMVPETILHPFRIRASIAFGHSVHLPHGAGELPALRDPPEARRGRLEKVPDTFSPHQLAVRGDAAEARSGQLLSIALRLVRIFRRLDTG